MINVLCVFKSGGVFGPSYPLRLAAGVRRHLPARHRFICLNDVHPEELFDTDNNIHWMPLRHGWPGWWSKVEMFRPDLERFGRFLYIDLSAVMVGDLSDIAAYDGPACIVSDFYYGGPSQSVLNFAPGTMRRIWDEFTSNPVQWMERGDKCCPPDFGDQILMNRVYGDGIDRFQDLTPGQVVSYRVHCQSGLRDGARIVKFHGRPKPHEVARRVGWLREHWKISKGGKNHDL